MAGVSRLSVVRCSRHEPMAGKQLIPGTIIATVNYEFSYLSLEVFYYKTFEVKEIPTLKNL